MLEIILSQYGTPIIIAAITAIGSALSGSIGYYVARENNRNQFVLAALKEVNEENKEDKEDLRERIGSLQSEFDKIKYLEINCEREKGLLEVENEALKREIDLLIAFYNKPLLLKEFIEGTGVITNKEGKFFKYADIDEIYSKIIDD